MDFSRTTVADDVPMTYSKVLFIFIKTQKRFPSMTRIDNARRMLITPFDHVFGARCKRISSPTHKPKNIPTPYQGTPFAKNTHSITTKSVAKNRYRSHLPSFFQKYGKRRRRGKSSNAGMVVT